MIKHKAKNQKTTGLKVILVLALFFLTILPTFSYAQEMRQGLYYFNGGYRNRKDHTLNYVYGIGMRYRYSENLEILGAGLKNIFQQKWSLSYGIENSDTNRYGVAFPFFARFEYFSPSDFFEIHVTDRYIPDFYYNNETHFSSFGTGLKYPIGPVTWISGFELSRLLNQNKKTFGLIYGGGQRSFDCGLFLRLEYVHHFNTENIHRFTRWLTAITLGYIF